MKNAVQDGKVLTLTAPYAVSSGAGAQVGSIFGVATADVANGAEGEFETEGVFDLAKTSAQAWTVGQKIYWDNSNKRCDSDGTVGMLIGVATAVAANPSSTGYVKLNEAVVGTSEGPQAAIASFTDSTGAGANDATLADGLTATALTENAGAIGGSNDGNLPDLTATAAALTGTLTGTADGALADIAAAAGNCQGGATPTAAQVDTAIATAVATIVSGVNEQNKELQTQLNAAIADNIALRAAVREVANRVNTCITDLTTQNQNDSDIAAKVNVLLGELRTFGVIAAA